MGNSEVGHLNIGESAVFASFFIQCPDPLTLGAGRIVWQDIVRIDQSIRKDDISKNKDVLASFNRAKDGNGRLHLLGLVRVVICSSTTASHDSRSPMVVYTRTSTTSSLSFASRAPSVSPTFISTFSAMDVTLLLALQSSIFSNLMIFFKNSTPLPQEVAGRNWRPSLGDTMRWIGISDGSVWQWQSAD